MGTRAAAFAAKIRNLQDYHLRLTNCMQPQPTGYDVANTLKHFVSVLLGVLKDVPQYPLEMLKNRADVQKRLQLFPNLDYKGLYAVIIQLVDVVQTIQFGVQQFGQAILQAIAAILPFLDHDYIDALPYTVAAMLSTFPASLHQDILNLLCHHLIPVTLHDCQNNIDKGFYAVESVTAILTMVFQYTTSSEHHCQVLEAIMKYKKDAVKDMLCVIAYGTMEARHVAITLLVYYWPHSNSHIYDRRNIRFKFNGYPVPTCKSEMCSVHNSGGTADSVKICLDHSVAVSLSPENPPPLFLCQECSSRLESEHPSVREHLYEILQPVAKMPLLVACENKHCRSQGLDKQKEMVYCFDAECTKYNDNRPVRYCGGCHSVRHSYKRGTTHVYHESIACPLQLDDVELLNNHVEAIVSVLLDAEPLSNRGGEKDNSEGTRLRLFTESEIKDPISIEDRRLMGRFGIWLLVGFFKSEEKIPKDILGRLLSALQQWFNASAYIGDDPHSNTIETLKEEVLRPWMKGIIKEHFETFVSSLLPHPPEYSRVGGHWDIISSRTFHLREGFKRLFCLVPYEVVSFEIWGQIMPHWMEAMSSEVPEEELSELKMILSKAMDSEMNPLGFEARQMYHFISVRFYQTSHKVKEQALKWLQVLSKLEIVIPLYFIFSVFREGIRLKERPQTKRGSLSTDVSTAKDAIAAICQDDSPNVSSLSDDEDNVACHAESQTEGELMLSSFILMLDIILKQLELQEVEQHKGLSTLVAKDAMTLLHNMVAMPWTGKHTCNDDGDECQFCEMAVMWYQLALEIVQKLAPQNSAFIPDILLSPDGEFGGQMFGEYDKKHDLKAETKQSASPKSDICLEGIFINMPQILTATVETVSELDLAPIMPSEKVVKAVARAVTITESETATATAQIASARLVGDQESCCEGTGTNFWSTSVGRFKFSIEELPPHLQFTFELLKKIPDEEDPELMYQLLKCLRILFLHGEVMLKASKDHRGFLIWCQENLLIRNLWDLLDAEYSQISEQAVPILLHCITLPLGAEVFWNLIEEDFHSPDWRKRFTAVERAISITRFLNTHPVKNSAPLQMILASLFCYLISSLDDGNVAVAQRTALYIGTIHDIAVQTLMSCLEAQFDTVIIDRTVILQALYLLLNSVSDRKIMRWNFFLSCFDTLYIEAQISLERSGDVFFSNKSTEVKPMDGVTEIFFKKLHRVHEALSRRDKPDKRRTLYSGLKNKWPNRRLFCPPIGALPKISENNSKFVRPGIAPILKRKGSRHGIDGHIHSLLSGDEYQLSSIYHRIVEMEEADRETMHLLIFLFMQFLSRYNRGPVPHDTNKALGKTQMIVLKHVTMLLGYNTHEKQFFLPAYKIRSSPTFSAFISNLPQVLDQNFEVGKALVPISLAVLVYSPAPSRFLRGNMQPCYSLWFLESHIRRNWLISLIIILYKYDYSAIHLSNQVQDVIRIVVNTLGGQEHTCKSLPPRIISDEPTGRSREISRLNLTNVSDLEHIREHETPPTSPLTPSNVTPTSTTRAKHIAAIKKEKKASSSSRPSAAQSGVNDSFEFMSSTETDEIEPELAAIPESPKLYDSKKAKSFGEVVIVEPDAATIPMSRPIETFHPSELQKVSEDLHSFSVVKMESAKVIETSGKAKSKIVADMDSKSSGSSAGSQTSSGKKSTPSFSMASALGEFPWQLSVQAAVQVAKIPAPPLERLLPVGFNQTTKGKTSASEEADEKGELMALEKQEVSEIVCEPSQQIEKAILFEESGDLINLDAQEQTDMKPAKEKDEKNLKCISKEETQGRASPKKLVKQSNVIEIEDQKAGADRPDILNVFDLPMDQLVTTKDQQKDADKSTEGVSDAYYPSDLSLSDLRIGEDCIQERCSECGSRFESYSNEELGLCIVALETFIHREPASAATFLPEIMKIIAKLALKPFFPWQAECSNYFPGSLSSVTHQFIRCVCHQLAPFGIFVQLFQTKFPEKVKLDIFKSIAHALTDFTELNPVAPLQLLLEVLNNRKALVMDNISPIIENVATYMECLPLETAPSTWSIVIPLFETFLRKVMPMIQVQQPVNGILRTMSCILRVPGISAYKNILEPFSKILSFSVEFSSIKYSVLTELCNLSHKNFPREREKLFLTRIVVFELVQAIKFKASYPDENFLLLVTFILQDAGGTLAPFIPVDPQLDINNVGDLHSTPPNTGAAECMRQHMTDALDFLADFHSLSKIKSNYKGNGCGLNEDTLGGVIKGGISQYIALEISRGNSRENRTIARHLPWLYNPPSAIQQGPKEFLDCVAHIRVLSWILLGSLTHTAIFGSHSSVNCNPIPLEASCHVADHVVVILTGFYEQSKSSVLHMSSLFHAFILCQVWTVYLEQVGPSQMSNVNDPANASTNILTDFWGKVTPAILQLVSHSKVLAEMVNLHFLTLLESLLECNSSVFNRLLPLWTPVLHAHAGSLPGHIQMRLQACLGYPPPEISVGSEKHPKPAYDNRWPMAEDKKNTNADFMQIESDKKGHPAHCTISNPVLLQWIQKLQFKMAQIELQSSAATQFYPL